jgi:hypothetical protein
MAEETSTTKKGDKQVAVKVQGGSSSPVYGLGMIGAWVYYIRRAETTEEKVRGFLKGIVWPAFLVYDLLDFLKRE